MVMLLALGASAVRPFDADAQLLSPGELSESHADLEGLRNCTSCHQLRQRGVSDDLCLACHEPLAELIGENRGLHARIDDGCGSCHKEHGGRDLDIVRFDSLTFAHEDRVGFALTGAHAEASCRDCHTPRLVTTPSVRLFKREHGALERTFLGLGTACRSCHLLDDPHDGQFGERVCTDCHDESAWTPASGFDHDETRYRLTGRHLETSCGGCHGATPGGTVRYAPLAFGRCTSCHTDYHAGEMGPSCETCHSTRGWLVDRGAFEADFDHRRTGFDLTGAHAGETCSTCHTPGASPATIAMSFREETLGRTYPRPVAESCLSCHVDQHEGAFANLEGGPLCSGCHGDDAWSPSSYDLFRHNRETAFELADAHLAVSCASCHAMVGSAGAAPTSFAVADATCTGCHAGDQPHADQFAGVECTRCHTTVAFRIPSFDHDRTSYPLDETHREVACAGCHRPEPGPDGRDVVRYRPLETACRSCHGDPR